MNNSSMVGHASLLLLPIFLGTLGEEVQHPDPQEVVLELGAPADEQGVWFHTVRDIAIGPNGDLYVLDSGERHVLRFNSAGILLGSFGGMGEGPGEFRAPASLIVDSLVRVFDPPQARVAEFALDGTFRQTRQLPIINDHPTGKVIPLRHGWAIVSVSAGFARDEAGNDPYIRLLLVNADRTRMDSIAAFRASGARWAPLGRQVPWGLIDTPFGAAGAWALSGDSLIVIADGRVAELRWYLVDPSGLRIVSETSFGQPGDPVTRSDLGTLEDAFRATRSSTPARLEFSAPTVWSAATAVVVESNGKVWVRRASRDGSEWVRAEKDSDSAPRSVPFPEGFMLHAVSNDLAYGSFLLGDGTPVVRVYRVRE